MSSGVIQIAYHVADVDEAARRFARDFGWGPFFVLKHIPLTWCQYRGQQGRFDHSSAYGQAGNVMVELMQQHGDDPSACRDMYAAHEEGLHHMARFAPDMDAALAGYAAHGFPTAMRALTTAGVEFAMVDTRQALGHMIELYPPADMLVNFYAMVRDSAAGWDGTDPVRYL